MGGVKNQFENHNEYMHLDSDDFFVGGDPVQGHDHCPEDHGGHVGNRSQGEEDGVEGETIANTKFQNSMFREEDSRILH